MRNNVRKLTPYYRFRLIENDLDDNKFVDCAISANAQYIVTEDRHFDVLKRCSFPKVDVIGIDLFVRKLISTEYYHANDDTSLINESGSTYGEREVKNNAER